MPRTIGCAALVLLGVVLFAGLTACGGGDDKGADADGDSSLSDGDTAEAADKETNASCLAASFVGTWKGDSITLTLDEGLSYHAVGANEGLYDVKGSATLEGCTISLTDGTGTNPCPAEQIGVYRAAFTKDEVIFTLVSDACLGRSMGLGGKTLVRQ